MNDPSLQSLAAHSGTAFVKVWTEVMVNARGVQGMRAYSEQSLPVLQIMAQICTIAHVLN